MFNLRLIYANTDEAIYQGFYGETNEISFVWDTNNVRRRNFTHGIAY